MLSAAAVLGAQFRLDDVGEILGEQPGGLLRPLEEIMSRRIVVAVGAMFAFRDAAVHSDIYFRIPEPVRLALHRQIGTRLLERGGTVVPAARHLAQAARPGDVRILEVLDRATQEVLASAPRSAADFAQRALDLTPPDDHDRFERGVIAIEALMAADQRGAAASLARALLDEDPPGRFAFDLHMRLSWILVLSGEAEEAVNEAEAVVREPGLSESNYTTAESARLLALLAHGDFGQARPSAEAILAGTGPYRGDAALASALAVLSIGAWNAGHAADALSLMRGAAGRVDPAASDGERAFVHLGLGLMRRSTGDQPGADALAIDAERADESPAWRIALADLRSRTQLACGHLDEALEETDRALSLTEQLGTRFLVPELRATTATVALFRDDPERAGAQIALCESSRLTDSPHPLAKRAEWVHARVLEATLGRHAAFEGLAPVYADLTTYLPLLLEEPGAAAWLVRVALSENDQASATRVAFAAERLATENRSFACIGAIASHARGLLDRDVDALQRAAAAHWQPWARASAAEDAGAIFVEVDRVEESREQFASAVSEYLRAGSERDARRVRSRLRAASDKRRTRSDRLRPAEGWGSLTDGERRVVALVALGLTNRQVAERAFLSRHTVDFHLRQAFRKLNISSRVQLVRLAVEYERSA